ncbi:MAG: DUF6268 family outer membrane beta-barrel protein [Psychroserpens sp.]|uniref:DUF6268 family outer membrane beta-barrel protein n=1 Tax=Psychroserpens sp. TaxID=2020870 RepID=UPI0030033189
MHKLFKIIILITICSFNAQAQLNDLARIDYTFIPDTNSDVEFTRLRALFNYPIKLKKEGEFLLIGLDYSNIHLRFQNEDLPFDKEQLNDFQLLDLSIGYTKPLKNDWRLGIRIKPGFSTNLTANALSFEDIVLSAAIVFIKERKLEEGKKERLILGISYSGNGGYNFPLPFLSYYRKFHLKWSYNVGIPKTNLQYHISEKHRLKLYAELDGFTANLQHGVAVEGLPNAESINMSLIVGGFQYEYHFTKHLQFYARVTHIFSINNKLRDENKDNIYTLDNEALLYLRSGIRFKI